MAGGKEREKDGGRDREARWVGSGAKKKDLMMIANDSQGMEEKKERGRETVRDEGEGDCPGFLELKSGRRLAEESSMSCGLRDHFMSFPSPPMGNVCSLNHHKTHTT